MTKKQTTVTRKSWGEGKKEYVECGKVKLGMTNCGMEGLGGVRLLKKK